VRAELSFSLTATLGCHTFARNRAIALLIRGLGKVRATQKQSGSGDPMQRPTGVTVLAVLAFIGAGLLVLMALGMFLGGAILSHMSVYSEFGMLTGIGGAIVGVVLLGMAALDLILGLGLWKLQNWSRVLTIVLMGLAVLFNALGLLSVLLHFHSLLFLPQAIVVVIQVWIVIYLLKPHVKQAFGATGF
jgi:hypothetical protein